MSKFSAFIVALAALSLVTIANAFDMPSGDIGDTGGGGAAFSGDLNGNELEDTTDNIVSIKAGEAFTTQGTFTAVTPNGSIWGDLYGADGFDYAIWQDALLMQDAGTAPACDVSKRGLIWRDDEAGGTRDSLRVCLKNAADGYEFQDLLTIADTRSFDLRDSSDDVVTVETGDTLATDLLSANANDFVAIADAVRLADAGTQPTCDATVQGLIWLDLTAGANADTLEVCRKDVSEVFAWQDLLAGGAGYAGDQGGAWSHADTSDGIVDIDAGDALCFAAAGCLHSIADGQIALSDNANANGLNRLFFEETGGIGDTTGVYIGLEDADTMRIAKGATYDPGTGGAGYQNLHVGDQEWGGKPTQPDAVIDANGSLGFISTAEIGWSSSSSYVSGLDTGIGRYTAGVVKITEGTSGEGWLQVGDVGRAFDSCSNGTEGRLAWDDGAATSSSIKQWCVSESDGTAETFAYRYHGAPYGSLMTNADNTHVTGMSTSYAKLTDATDGLFNVAVVSDFTADVTASGDTLTWNGPTALAKVEWSASVSISAGTPVLSIGLGSACGTPTAEEECITTRTMGAASAIGNIGGTCILSVANAETLCLIAKVDAATPDLLVHRAHLTVTPL